MRRIAKSLLVLIGAGALAFGVSLPARAQGVNVCVQARVVVAGQVVVDQPQTCQAVEAPAAP